MLAKGEQAETGTENKGEKLRKHDTLKRCTNLTEHQLVVFS
jgi:hypothetical protein